MTETVHATETKIIHPDEVITYGVDFTPLLKASEVLTGTPLAVEVGTSDLTITGILVNTATFLTDEGVTVQVGKGVQLIVSTALTGVTYDITVTATSPAPDSNTRVVVCKLVGES